MTRRLWRCCWLAVLVGHGLLSLVGWWLTPGGFRVGHPRFWTNSVAPPSVLGLSIATLVALRGDRIGALRQLLPLWPAAWAAAAIALRVAFPITMARNWLIPMAVATWMGIAAIRPWRLPGDRRWAGLLLPAIGAVGGVGMVLALRPPASATHPVTSRRLRSTCRPLRRMFCRQGSSASAPISWSRPATAR